MTKREMDPKTRRETDLNQGAVARIQWIHNRCMDLPPVYQNLIPATTSAAELVEAEKTIRAMIKRDIEEYSSNPWLPVGSERMDLVDWTDVPFEDRCGTALKLCGVPNRIRQGFETHPEVLEAIEASKGTAEYLKTCAISNIRQKIKAAEKEEMDACAASAPPEVIDGLEAKRQEFMATRKRIEDTTLDDLRAMGPGFDPTAK